MKRTSTVRVTFDNGCTATAVVTTNNPKRYRLTRDETRRQHDAAINKVSDSLRDLPYTSFAPLRSVTIR